MALALTLTRLAMKNDNRMNKLRGRRQISAAMLCAALAACTNPAAREQEDARLAKARQMFQERCQRAGERIVRTVPDVESVLLLKVRPKVPDYYGQFTLSDPYGDDLGGDGYIGSFIKGSYVYGSNGARPTPETAWMFEGYRYVEAVDPIDGNRYRYTGAIRDVTHTSSVMMGGDGRHKFVSREWVLDKTATTGEAPRYAITYDDISTHEEREYWIAGSSLRVVDTQTHEVIAERIGYMMDPGQGRTGGGRSPWSYAAKHSSCPQFGLSNVAATQAGQAQRFTLKVLIPAKGD